MLRFSRRSFHTTTTNYTFFVARNPMNGTMIRSAATRLSYRTTRPYTRRLLSSNPLEADTGALSTHAYHTNNLGLAVLTPLYFLFPVEDGMLGKTFGVVLAGTMSAHSWIGLNYVGTNKMGGNNDHRMYYV